MTQKDLLEDVLKELKYIKGFVPNGELAQVINTVNELKGKVEELTKMLMHPETGLIVKVNENTRAMNVVEETEKDRLQHNADLREIVKWKDGVNKALWIIFSTLIAMGVKIIFFLKGGQ